MEEQRISVHPPERTEPGVRIERIGVHAFKIPTEEPESDGTLVWDATTMVLVEAHAAGHTGLGYSYTSVVAAHLIEDKLKGVVEGRDLMSVSGCWFAMHHAVRNLGRPGIAASAIAAVDIALWDLKARVLNLALVDLLDAPHEAVPVYGSGGFTSYTSGQLRDQFSGWVDSGISMVKMKVGRDPNADLKRVEEARETIGDKAGLFVDANAAYHRKQALWFAEAFADFGVSWFEEPVSSDDLDGLRFIRDRAPSGMDITAGEYGYDLFYFSRMLQADAVDVLQADATRCAGFTGFLKAGLLCEPKGIGFSAHTAPNLHAHPACAVLPIRNVEYFFDHARIEHMLLDGALEPKDGKLRPDHSRRGMGFSFKWADAEPYRIFGHPH